MSSHFYATLSRMEYIYRWGLMRNTKPENLSTHSLETAFFAHALAIIKNKKFGGNINPEKAAVAAMFHDTTEIFTGDMPTPVKYFNPEIRGIYKEIEDIAADKLTSMLPEYMREDFTSVYSPDADTEKIVKAADKISAYVKCIKELKIGNTEFASAKESIEQKIKNLNMPEVDEFMSEFIPSFFLSLDEQQSVL